jgi:tetratricopeptide (TPR) repeat protein
VVLAGRATALDVRKQRTQAAGDGKEGEESLPGLAAELLDHGIPTVLAMQAPVSDAYATELTARLYGALATHADPAPLAALAEARREAEQHRAKLDPKNPVFHLAEWATPALYLRGTPQLLYDPAAPPAKIQEPPEARFTHGVVVRKVGEFVGRRREERLILKTLRGDRHAGALIHGIGGVGKSTLAAEVLSRLMADHHLVVSTYGETAPETILEEIGNELVAVSHAAGVPENHPLRQIAPAVRRPDAEWKDRLDLLQRTVLPQIPLVLLLDNFESNLADPEEPGGDHTVKNQALAAFLTRWLQAPGKSRLLVTSRYPFTLPESAHRHLDPHHLGPLSPAETRKLLWRLPALEALNSGDRRRAYEAVGGHPRALEYLDALLRGGEARFTDVELRLEKALKKEGVKNPGAWIRDQIGADLDKALAETVTLASADVLLEDLLKLLDPTPLARQLLLGASVYRVPVDPVALAWQVGKEVEPEPDPEGKAIRKRVYERAQEVKEKGEEPSRENLGLTDAEWQAYDKAIRRALTPPIEIPEGIAEAQQLLEQFSLLSQIPTGESTLEQVHRWTASALEKDTEPETLRTAHRRAGRYFRWRVDKMPQSRQAAIDQLLEARHHHHAAGDVDQAVEVTEWICSQLDTWGAYGREEQLCREALEWVPERSREAGTFLRQLGVVAEQRGSYEEAGDWYRKALVIYEELGDRADMASAYGQLAIVAQLRGSYDEELEWYRKSLPIYEELGNRPGTASFYHKVGMWAEDRGSYEEARDWYRKALAIDWELGNRNDWAATFRELGMVAAEWDSYEQARDSFRKALAIDEEQGNRAGMATSYHQLGVVAEHWSSYEDALEWHRKSLAIHEELGNSAGIATSYHQIGIVAHKRSSYEEALEWYRKALAINEELGNRAGIVVSLGQIGVLLTQTGRPEEAVPWNLRSLSIHRQIGVPEVRIDLHWLGRQREALGEERFGEVLREHLDEKATANVLRMLDESEQQK